MTKTRSYSKISVVQKSKKKSQKLLFDDVKVCKSTISQFLGLMFTLKRNQNTLLFVFDRDLCCSFHMFFVFFPIDILFLDSNKKIIAMKKNFKPFTLLFPKTNKKKFRYVVECKAGSIEKNKLKLRDKLVF